MLPAYRVSVLREALETVDKEAMPEHLEILESDPEDMDFDEREDYGYCRAIADCGRAVDRLIRTAEEADNG